MLGSAFSTAFFRAFSWARRLDSFANVAQRALDVQPIHTKKTKIRKLLFQYFRMFAMIHF